MVLYGGRGGGGVGRTFKVHLSVSIYGDLERLKQITLYVLAGMAAVSVKLLGALFFRTNTEKRANL